MARYEITGTATDRFSLTEIQNALREAGAVQINKRRAFGWRNQPHVATFSAESDVAAGRIARKATDIILNGEAGPSILAYGYDV